MKAFNPGEFRHQITFAKFVDSENEIHESVQTMQDVKTVYAKIVPVKPMTLKGGAFLDDLKVLPEIIHQITVRYSPDITSDMLIRYGSRVFQIIGIMNPDERNILLEIDAVEKVPENGN